MTTTTTFTTKTLADELGTPEASVLVWLDQLALPHVFASATGRKVTVDGYKRTADLILPPDAVAAVREQARATTPTGYVSHLYDANTDEDLGPATPAQVAASDAAEAKGQHGIFGIDSEGDPVDESNASFSTRAVYTY